MNEILCSHLLHASDPIIKSTHNSFLRCCWIQWIYLYVSRNRHKWNKALASPLTSSRDLYLFTRQNKISAYSSLFLSSYFRCDFFSGYEKELTVYVPTVTLMAFHILLLFYLVIMQDVWSRKRWLIQTMHLTKTLLLVGTAGHYCKSNTKNVCPMSLSKIERKNYCRSKLALIHLPELIS